MTSHLDDAYWTEEFDITVSDLDRIAARIGEQRTAISLDKMAERVVYGRLRHGPEESPSALPPGIIDSAVRLWDATGDFHCGDRVIVARSIGGGLEVFLAEIAVVEPGQVRVRLDRTGEKVTYRRQQPGSAAASRWRARLEKEVEEKMIAPDLTERSRAVLARHGERIIGRLQAALEVDARFLELDNRWFLRELLQPLGPAQLTGLFRQLLDRTTPVGTAELVQLVSPPLPEGDVGLFSLYQALAQAPQRFRNVGSATRPLWEAIAPKPIPPEHAVVDCYAYDPTTYEILVRPGQRMTPRLAQRLQELDLYVDLVSAADETAL